MPGSAAGCTRAFGPDVVTRVGQELLALRCSLMLGQPHHRYPLH
ncbi:hypothetical protein [Arthrobacter nitrophenolicus]|nr:hypothetical protein [Arthrobacter nitrophenolicus]